MNNVKKSFSNQEDMIGTNLAFSFVALRELKKIGVKLSLEDQDRYIHFWAVVGALMGIKDDLVPKVVREAFWMEQRIAKRHFAPSREGKELTRQLIRHYKENIPNKGTVLLIEPLIRYMLGDELSSTIGLKSSKGIYPVDQLMRLLPLFKKFIFPPVQSFEMICDNLEEQKKAQTARA